MQVDPSHMTIEQARIHCGISFVHAWSLVTSGAWSPVRVGAGNRIIRVWREQVENTKAVWDNDDVTKRKEYRALAKAARKARKTHERASA